MEQLEKKISYLRGLADGMDVSESSREGKIVSEVIHLLDDMYAEIKELHARIEETEEYTEAIDEDLEDLELLLYGDDEDLYESVDDCEDHRATSELDERFNDLDDDDEAYTYELIDGAPGIIDTSYEIECPTCHEIIFLHEGLDDEGYRHYVIEPAGRLQEPINAT